MRTPSVHFIVSALAGLCANPHHNSTSPEIIVDRAVAIGAALDAKLDALADQERDGDGDSESPPPPATE